MPEAHPRVGRRKAWRGFYLFISILMTAMAMGGFWPTFFGPIVSGTLDLEPIFILHGIVYMGWMVLLILQAALVFSGRTGLHRKVGVFGVGYAALLISVGLWLMSDRFGVYRDAGDLRQAHRSLVVPLFDLLIFSGFFLAAVLWRKRPEAHKRLIVVATLVIIGPGVSRMTFLTTIPMILLMVLLPALCGIVHDLFTRRRPHPVYVIGIIVILASAVRLPVRDSDWWFDLSRIVFGWLE